MRRVGAAARIFLIAFLVTALDGGLARAMEEEDRQDFLTGYFFVDVFGCLFPMNGEYILRVKTAKSYFFSNRLELASGPSVVKRISIENADNVEEVIAKYRYKLVSDNGILKHYSALLDSTYASHIIHDDNHQMTIINESLNEIEQKIQYCTENPTH